MTRQGRRSGGFTLVELVIVVAVIGVIAGLFVHYLDEGTRMFEAVDARKNMTMEARQAMIRAIREIRQLRSASDVVAADATHFTFVAVDDSLYGLAYDGTPGGALTLRRGAVTGPIATGVDSVAFEYFKDDGTPAVPLVAPGDTDIHRVGVFLRLRRGGEVVALRSGTYVRNVR